MQPEGIDNRRYVSCRLAAGLILVVVIFLMTGCPEPPPPPVEEKLLALTEPPALAFFEEDLSDRQAMLDAIDRQRAWFLRKATASGTKPTWQFDQRVVDVETMIRSIELFRDIYACGHAAAKLRSELSASFDFYKMGGVEPGNVLFTGYYTPIMPARKKQDKQFSYPLYRLPDDLITVNLGLFVSKLAGTTITGRYEEKQRKFLPYYTREEIDWDYALRGRKLEIAWLADYIDQFFLHIQGGGILEIEKGERVYVNYAGKNGRAFTGVGRLLIDDGEIPREIMSMQAIRDYFLRNPEKIRHYCRQNESYIFYERGSSGPYGSLGLVVTPERSIATDKRHYPGGAVCLIAGRIPIPHEDGRYPLDQRDFSRFVLDQDTGGAITGRHIDVYCGAGALAASQAGSLNCRGDVYMLVIKETKGSANP